MKCAIESCNAGATRSGYCFWHDPDIDIETKQAARSRGGRNSKPVQPWNIPEEIQPIETLTDLKKLYNSALSWLTKGQITPSQAHALKSIASGLRDVMELELIRELATGRVELEELLEKPVTDYVEVNEWPMLLSSKSQV